MDKLAANNSIIERLFKAFPEAGIITIARMAEGYDQFREPFEFYKELAFIYFNENIQYSNGSSARTYKDAK